MFQDVLGYLMKSKKFWLVPIIFALILFGSILFLSAGTALSPFIYALF